MRDINALKRNVTFIENHRSGVIVIDKSKLDYYIYVDVFKRHANRLPYYYGNCDVFIDRALFDEYRDAFVADAVEHHPFLAKSCRTTRHRVPTCRRVLRYADPGITGMYVDARKRNVIQPIRLTSPTGKMRVKTRSLYHEYGQPHSSRSNRFTQRNYIEWQISYDTANEEDLPERYLRVAYREREEQKYFTELSCYLYIFHKWDLIRRHDLLALIDYLQNIDENSLIANHEHCRISRTHPTGVTINEIPFSSMILRYPQLVYHFQQYDIVAEVTIREKQRAVGVRPMLYFCIPIPELTAHPPLIGRTAKKNERACFVFSEDNYRVIFELVKVFGILSDRHRDDVLRIIDRALE